MKNILLPTDFSINSWNAIKYAIHLFKNETCNFYLLYVHKLSNTIVVNHSYAYANDTVLDDVHAKPATIKLHNILKQITKHFPINSNHKFYTLYDNNFFIESIRKHVKEKKIDIIVIGTKGASALKKIIVGSNTSDVITKVKCTTIAVPENTKYAKPKEIAFPTDFSLNYDMRMLQPLSDILDKHNPALNILNVSKSKTDLNAEQKQNTELLDDYFSYVNHSFHYVTNSNIENAIQCFIENRHIDMICMMAKNLNYFQQILFHNKVKEINYHTEIPFLILHEKN